MNYEQWDYKIDGKTHGIMRMVICLVLFAVFAVLTIDQLLPRPNKSLFVAFAFGVMAATSLYILIQISVRYFCFKVYIGREGFYFQSGPFRKKYYEYTSIKSCREELQVSHTRHVFYSYFFIFTDTSGKSTKFIFEKTMYEREIHVLKKRIESAKRQRT